jgi:hypothetical protein
MTSNASTDLYTENTLTEFKNELPRDFQVEGYKIALQSLYLDNKFGNIPNSILGTKNHFLLFVHNVQVKHPLPSTTCSITDYVMSITSFANTVRHCLVSDETRKNFEIGVINAKKRLQITLRNSFLLIHPEVNKYLDFSGESVKYNGLEYTKLDSRKHNTYLSHIDFPTKAVRPSLIKVQLKEMCQNLSGLKQVQDLAIIKVHPRNQYPIYNVCKRKEYFNLNCTRLTTLSARLVDEDNYPLQLSSGQPTFLKLQFKKFPMKSFVLRLSSLESSEVFSDNTSSSFRIQLREPLQCCSWDVALSSIYLPAKTDIGEPLTAENFHIEIPTVDGVIRLALHNLQDFTAEGLVKHLQSKLSIAFEGDPNPPLVVDLEDEGSDKIYLYFHENITIKLSGMLAYLLNSAASPREPVSIVGKNRIRHLAGTPNFKKLHPHLILVYCNFITPIVVGSEFGTVLQMVPYYDSDSGGATIMKYEAQHLDFLPMTMNDPTTLQFEMRNSAGDSIRFQNEDTEILLTLVFREKL